MIFHFISVYNTGLTFCCHFFLCAITFGFLRVRWCVIVMPLEVWVMVGLGSMGLCVVIGLVKLCCLWCVIFVLLMGGDELGVLCASCGMFVPFVSLLSFISLSPPSWLTILVLHFLISFLLDLCLFDQRSLSSVLFGASVVCWSLVCASVGLWTVP